MSIEALKWTWKDLLNCSIYRCKFFAIETKDSVVANSGDFYS